MAANPRAPSELGSCSHAEPAHSVLRCACPQRVCSRRTISSRRCRHEQCETTSASVGSVRCSRESTDARQTWTERLAWPERLQTTAMTTRTTRRRLPRPTARKKRVRGKHQLLAVDDEQEGDALLEFNATQRLFLGRLGMACLCCRPRQRSSSSILFVGLGAMSSALSARPARLIARAIDCSFTASRGIAAIVPASALGLAVDPGDSPPPLLPPRVRHRARRTHRRRRRRRIRLRCRRRRRLDTLPQGRSSTS